MRHQTGVRDEAVTREAYAAAGYDPACVSAFIDDMASAYAWADLVLCRAGATTVAELCAAGLPSVLVPFPYAVHDHQTRNAQALVAEGAALMLPEARMESDGLMAAGYRQAAQHGRCGFRLCPRPRGGAGGRGTGDRVRTVSSR